MNNKKQNLELRTQNLEGAKIQGSRRGTEVFRAKWSQFSERSSLSSGMTMNSLGRGNWVLMFGLLVIVIFNLGFVEATPDWNESAYNITYNATEDIVYSHNLTLNLTNYNPIMTFEISATENITWNGAEMDYSEISDWMYINDSFDGLFIINATRNNQTGNFTIRILANDDTGTLGVDFTFNVSSVNDPPNFTELVNGGAYNFTEDSTSNLIIQYNATDEEGEYDGTGYPLNFSSNVTWCNSSINITDCNDLFSLSRVGNKSMELNISRTDDYVGYYNVTFWVNDSVSQTEVNVSFEIVNTNDAPNITFACDDNRSMTEDDIMSCWINATDVDEEGNLTFVISSNLGQFTFNDSSTSYVYDCLGGGDCNASANVTFVLNDSAVGNWSVNISVTDTGTEDAIDWANFSFFVNNTEDNVTMDSKASFTEYEGSPHQFNITAYDDDLRVDDTQTSVKNEALTFATNDSNIIYNLDAQTVSGNKSVIIAYINWSYAQINNITNASIKINVTDRLGVAGPEIYSFDETIFTITFDNNNSAPNWTGTIYDFLIEENSSWSGVNLSNGYVNDSDGESISFYYTNDTQFDNFDLSNSSGSWIINFTAEDVDVGYHNMTLIASDGNVNVTQEFNFTVSNIADSPEIYSLSADNGTDIPVVSEGINIKIAESDEITFELVVDDADFLIPDYQIENYDYYNESLIVETTITNSTGQIEDLFNFSFIEFGSPNPESASYNASFTPTEADNYTIIINITDNSSISINRTFYLNVTGVNDAPNLTLIANQSLTFNDIFYLDINATDEESGNDEDGVLEYFLNFTYGNDFVNDNETIFNTTSGIFNFTLNSSYVGEYRINVTVTDGSKNDSQVFYLYVYGNPNITAPIDTYQFNWTEANSTGDLIFNVSYAINNTNLTYVFYMDNIVYYNATHFDYTDLIVSASLRNETNFSLTFENNFTWNYTPTYTDETYGFLKNLTLIVSNPDYPELNDSVNWKVNISHTNQNVSFRDNVAMPDKGPISYGSTTDINLSDYFEDVDYWDETINQNVNFTITTVNGSGFVALSSSFSNWILTLGSTVAVTEVLEVVAHEYDSDGNLIGNATSDPFNVEFIAPVVVTTPSSGGGTTTKLKHFSIKLIVPQDVIISEMNYIDIPFTVQNNGEIDLKGINLNSFVRFNDEFSDDVKISLGDNYIELLKFGQSENFTMRILANTQKAGKYKATIVANVTSPKLSDWGEFFIELRKTNESEAEQILIFTEKFISENPECLELTELIRRAEAEFLTGDYSKAVSSAREATEACENAIIANEQIKYPITGFVRDNFYYISFSTLTIFLLGFAFYVYKRVRFNKYKVDEYI